MTVTAANQNQSPMVRALPDLDGFVQTGFVNGDTSAQPHDPAADFFDNRNLGQPRGGQSLCHHGQRRGRFSIILLTGVAGTSDDYAKSAPLAITANNQSKAYGAALPR